MIQKKHNLGKKGFKGLMLGLLLAILMAFGCSGGGSGSADATVDTPTPPPQEDTTTGDVNIALTDNPGDFIAYKVNVVSIKLTKASGAVVETLPLTTEVDFAQYADMSEFFRAASISAGTYTKAEMTLDYTNADIRVVGSSGETVAATQIVDENGNPVTTLTVSITLEDIGNLIIVPGGPIFISFDFDLEASNQVELLSGGAKITVSPVLIASVEPGDKPYRVRGPLSSVDAAGSAFDVSIHPFRTLIAGDHRYGNLKVYVTADSEFVIDGVPYRGADGLSALNVKGASTPVTVFGELKASTFRFEAINVFVGASVPGGASDVVTGNVTQRTTDTVKIRGAILLRDEGAMAFNRDTTITISAGTIISRQLSSASYTSQDISIGQRIMVFGTVSNPAADNNYTMTVAGYANLLVTSMLGIVNSVNPTQPRLFVNLDNGNGIDLRNTSLFDFTGSGDNPQHTANADDYRIDTGTLLLDSISANRPVKVRGFVREYGKTVDDDFTALSVIDLQNVRGLLNVDWLAASANALTEITSSSMKLNLTGVGNYHRINRAGAKVDLVLPNVPVIQPYTLGFGAFVIGTAGGPILHLNFSDYAADLNARIAAGATVKHVWAFGKYDDLSLTMTAGYVAVALS